MQGPGLLQHPQHTQRLQGNARAGPCPTTPCLPTRPHHPHHPGSTAAYCSMSGASTSTSTSTSTGPAAGVRGAPPPLAPPPHSRSVGSVMARAAAGAAAAAASHPPPQVMVNSLSGKMGQAVADAVLRAGLELVPFTLCAADVAAAGTMVLPGPLGGKVQLVGPEARDAAIGAIKQQYPNLVMVDYTVPDAIHGMADFYVRHRTPFVMGTTGGDRARLTREVEEARLFAVIAPNMGKQIVAFQAMFMQAAASYPGAFAGYKLRVVESHQSTKKDTSGTAKAVVASLKDLGLEFDVEQIELVREPKQQMEMMKVPESALDGHAFHTYQLISADGTVSFEFQHNVVGRTTYAEGSVDACLFLAAQRAMFGEAPQGRTLFNMQDVLKAGAMR